MQAPECEAATELIAGRSEGQKWPLWVEATAAGLFLGPITMLVYRYAAARGATQSFAIPWWVETPLDRLVPVVPAAVWVYVSWYPAIALLVLTDRATLRRGYIGFSIAFTLCSVGFFLWPFTIDRPMIDATAGLSPALLSWFYGIDPPLNLFPSFHAAGAGLVGALLLGRPVLRWAGGAWAMAVCISCVLIRQHFIVDVVAGLVIGGLAASASNRLVVAYTRKAATVRESALIHQNS